MTEHLSKEGIEFIQQSCKQEEPQYLPYTNEDIERIKAITPQQWVDMMRPLFSTPYFSEDVSNIFVTEEVKEEILRWGVYSDEKEA